MMGMAGLTFFKRILMGCHFSTIMRAMEDVKRFQKKVDSDLILKLIQPSGLIIIMMDFLTSSWRTREEISSIEIMEMGHLQMLLIKPEWAETRNGIRLPHAYGTSITTVS